MRARPAVLAFTVAAIASVLLAIGAVVVLPLVLEYAGLGSASEMILSIARWPLLLALIIIGLAVLYRFGRAGESRVGMATGWERVCSSGVARQLLGASAE